MKDGNSLCNKSLRDSSYLVCVGDHVVAETDDYGKAVEIMMKNLEPDNPSTKIINTDEMLRQLGL